MSSFVMNTHLEKLWNVSYETYHNCIEEVVFLLSKKYEFSTDEAMEYLKISKLNEKKISMEKEGEKMNMYEMKEDGKEEKEKKSSNPKSNTKQSSNSNSNPNPKIPLPFVGKIFEERCKAIKLNHELHTQCNNKHLKSGDYCSVCQKQSEKNASGKPNYGDIRDRLNYGLLEYRDVKGKLTKPYIHVVEKLGLSREEIERECVRMGIQIPEEHWVKRESKRGRPKNNEEKKGQNKRGRPKKSKDVKSEVGDDLLEALKNVEKEDKNKEDDMKKEEKMEEKEDVKEIVENDEEKMEDTVEDVKEVVENDEEKMEDTVEDVKEVVENDEEKMEDTVEDEEESSEVEEFKLNGVTYLKSEDNNVYDIETHEHIGEWNPETNEIEEAESDSESEEESDTE